MNAHICLRKVKPEDLMLLFEWANDPDVRHNSFNSAPIPLEEHIRWFNSMAADPDRYQYLLMLDDNPIGQIRLDCAGDEAEINYSIAREYRGKGYGVEIIKLIKDEVKANLPDIKKLVGKVLAGNKASESCFKQCDFENSYSCFEYRIT